MKNFNPLLSICVVTVTMLLLPLSVSAQCIDPTITSIGNSGATCVGETVTLSATGEIGGISSSYIRMAGIGGNFGNREFDDVFAKGDRPGEINRISTSDFNAIVATGGASELRSRYDVLLFTWNSPTNLNVSWPLIEQYLSLGGSIFWEDEKNISKLRPTVDGYEFNGTFGNNYQLVQPAPFPQLVANDVTGHFVNHHLSIRSWPSWMKLYITGPSPQNIPMAIAGIHPTGGGRFIIQGPDQDFHATHSGGSPGGNQYKMLLNQVDFLIAEQTGISWTGPNGFTSNEANPILTNVTADMAGEYVATLTNISGGGCSVSATTTVSINAAPIVELGPDVQICTVSTEITASVSGGSGSFSYLWNTGATTASINAVPGTYTVTVTDGSGCSSSDAIVISEGDTNPPTALAQNVTVTLDATGNATIGVEEVDNGSTDDCGVANIVLSKTAFNCEDLGENTVSLTVTDNKGNTSVASAVVTVTDSSLPVVNVKSISVNLGEDGTALITPDMIENGSTDNCGIAEMSIDRNSFDCTMVGENNVKLTITDNSGNISEASAVVTVLDPVAPVLVTKDISVTLDDSGRTSVLPESLDNGSSDSCGGLIFSLSTSEFDCTNVGLNEVSVTATDQNGNSTTGIANITVIDTNVPVVETRDISVVLDENGKASITAEDIDNGTSDACGIATLNLDIKDFDCSNIGQNTVTLTAVDNNGNTAKGTAILTVLDESSPVVKVKNVLVTLDETGNASITTTDIDNGSGDACGIATMSLDIDRFDCSSIGDNTVILEVIDVNGNTATGSAIVTVTDAVVPLVQTSDIIVKLDANGLAEITPDLVNNGSYDACGISSLVLDKENFDCSSIGPNTVILTATDINGNSSSASAQVTVIDDVAPTVLTSDIRLHLDQFGEARIEVTDIDAGTSDACGIQALSIDKKFFDCSNVGENIITITATDVNGNTSNGRAVVTIENELPVILDLSLPTYPKQVNEQIMLSANFVDVNISDAQVSWGDGSVTSANIETGVITSSHYYSQPGVYRVTTTITDVCGLEASNEYQYVVIYDPDGGFVSGGGWLYSAAGNYLPDPSLEGKANFGFVAKYKKGANIPDGNTQFKFTAGNLEFSSTSYDWLVVAGNKAKYKGEGTINDIPGYFFMLTALDSDSRDSPDLFRIKIWDASENIIYDNQPGAADDASATTAIGGGSITVNDGRSNRNMRLTDEVNSLNGVRLYPNPTANKLTIDISSSTVDPNLPLKIMVLDTRGVYVERLYFESINQSKIELNAENYKSGVYIIMLQSADNLKSLRFMKK